MKGNRFLIGLVFTACCLSSVVVAEDEKFIYNWEANGLIYYSHIRPADVNDFVKLDSKGRAVEELSDDFDEVIEIAVRPKADEQEQIKEGIDAQVEKDLASSREIKQREKNCKTAQKNMSTIESGEVYEPDANGNMIRMKAEQIVSKRANVQKDIDYFCGEQ